MYFKGFLKKKNCFLYSVAGVAFGLASSGAMAQQIKVGAGQTIEQDGGTYRNLNYYPANSVDESAIVVGVNGTFIGSNLTLLAAETNPIYGMANIFLGQGAKATLINVNMAEGKGIVATGAGGVVIMEGGKITSVNDALEAAYTTVTFNNVTIDINNSVNGTSTAANAGYVRGIAANNDATVYLNGGTMTVSAENYRSVAIMNMATVNLDGTVITMTGGAAAVDSFRQLPITDESDISLSMKNFTVTTRTSALSQTTPFGIYAYVNGRVRLDNGLVETYGDGAYALYARASTLGSTVVRGDQLTLTTTGQDAHAVNIWRNAIVNLTNTDITTEQANGLNATIYGTITLTGGSITLNGASTTAAYAGDNTSIKLDNVDVISSAASITAGYATGTSTVTLDNSRINLPGASAIGAYATDNSTINLNNTTINLTGVDTQGLAVVDTANQNTFNVSGSTVSTPQGTAISLMGGDTVASFTSGSSISGDYLLVASNSANLNLTSDSSTFTGTAAVDGTSTTNLNLQNGSEWTVAPSSSGLTFSSVSTLSVTDSTISFATPVSGVYQTLIVGAGVLANPAAPVYNGSGATLKLNTFLNEGGALSNQQTDRLLVNGSVSGTTSVVIQPMVGGTGALTDLTTNGASNGISVVQVSGDASESSFQLLGGYVTAVGSPYQYSLYAYGPTSTNGAADETQRLVSGSNPFWDYRLQSVYVEPVIPPVDPGVTDPQHPSTGGGNGGGGAIIIPERVRAVAPQVANYLIAPTALFHAGLQDMSSLHQRLGEIRDDRLTGRNSGTGEFFIRGYGGVYNYKSNRNAYRYGYDADINYAAMQMGGSLYALETQEGILRLGVAGTVGTVSFDPKNVNGTNSTRLDKWSVSAFATYLHNSGFYVDGILSYGAFDGNVSTTYRGKTASLSGQTFSASLEMGYPIHFLNGVVLEPQAQVVYQRLMFDRKLDVDMFEVRLGDIDQVTARVGARLSKTYTQSADSLITVYAKANMLHTFNNSNKVYLGDTFRIGDFGTSIEGGLGVNATVSKNLSVYGDVAYQHRVGKSGVSGVSLTGGLRYSF
ncbi:autotransporter outer membrane beta-barrel domain-containing protein [Microvirga sp. W0021]|uniref:Autotransporter outer membrane beta-barrel domain-containing protein n=1 Tax=Hohaiivirga grylli TaxID=3133970 RepID=A0ABV0BFE5_9HYPH